jgi:hypothetical protein
MKDVKIRFQCAYCPASFSQFKDIVDHFESEHHVVYPVNGKQELSRRYITDGKTYGGSDSGCEAATAYLGKPSSCLKCPFRKCVLERGRIGIAMAQKLNRNEEIRRLVEDGMSVKDAAKRFGVTLRTIQRVVKDLPAKGD